MNPLHTEAFLYACATLISADWLPVEWVFPFQSRNTAHESQTTVIQAYAPTSNAEEAEVERFYATREPSTVSHFRTEHVTSLGTL